MILKFVELIGGIEGDFISMFPSFLFLVHFPQQLLRVIELIPLSLPFSKWVELREIKLDVLVEKMVPFSKWVELKEIELDARVEKMALESGIFLLESFLLVYKNRLLFQGDFLLN